MFWDNDGKISGVSIILSTNCTWSVPTKLEDSDVGIGWSCVTVGQPAAQFLPPTNDLHSSIQTPDDFGNNYECTPVIASMILRQTGVNDQSGKTYADFVRDL